MQKSFVQLATRLRGQERSSTYKRNWYTASRDSHELLDKDLGRRQHRHFKSLRNARRPFYHYFRQMYLSSPTVSKPAINHHGQISSYQAVKMVSKPNASWRTPWDSIGKSGYGSQEQERRRSGKLRQDVIEPLPIQFGEDEADRTIASLLKLRFEWDKQDELLVQRVVPASMYTLCSHSARFATTLGVGNNLNNIKLINTEIEDKVEEDEDEDGSQVVYISGVKVKVRSPLPSPSSSSSSSSSCSLLRFSGVEAIPSFVLDLTRGPFISHPREPLLTLRWKAENRNASSVLQVIQQRRRLHATSLIALPPRSLLYLVKVVACAEMEEPALDVAIAVAVAENINGYSLMQCVELLRCLRRIAFVQRLPQLGLQQQKYQYHYQQQQYSQKQKEQEHTLHKNNQNSSISSDNNNENKETKLSIPLYQNARLMQCALTRYAWDASPLLIERVWSRLPQIVQHFQRHHRYLDWIDAMLLSLELHGVQRLPSNLPNAVSHVTSACKYLFLRYTIHMDKSFMHSLVRSFNKQHILQLITRKVKCNTQREQFPLHITRLTDGHWRNASRAQCTNGLILWTVASTLIRLAAQSVGQLVQYVLRILHSYVTLIKMSPTNQNNQSHSSSPAHANQKLLPSMPQSRRTLNSSNTSKCKQVQCTKSSAQNVWQIKNESKIVPFPIFQHYTLHPYYAKMKINRVRWRLLPFISFPTIHRALPPPCWSITQNVIAKLEAQQQSSSESKVTHQAKEVASYLVTNVTSSSTISVDTSAQLQKQKDQRLGVKIDDDDNDGDGGHSLTIQQSNTSASNTQYNIKQLQSCSIRQSYQLLQHVQRACECLIWGTHVLQCSRALIYNLPLHDGLDSAERCKHLANKSNNDNTHFSQCDKIERQRSQLCYAFARSKVQLHMDALFDFIDWKEIDALLHDMKGKLTVQRQHSACTVATHSQPNCSKVDLTKNDKENDNVQRQMKDSTQHKISSGANKNQEEQIRYDHTSMQQMNDVEIIQLLHERVDKFELAVADMLDEHERYFSELYEMDMTGDANN